MKTKNESLTITIINWDEYQTRKDLKTMSWFRLESNLPEHEAFFNLSNEGKWFFVFLLCLCAKKSTGNINVKLDYLEHYSQVKKDIIIKSLDIMNEYELIRYEIVTETLPTYIQTNIHTEEQNELNPKEQEYIIISNSIIEYFNTVCNKKLTLTEERKKIIINRLKEGKTEEMLKNAILNFSKDTWEERSKYCDLIYAIGKQKGKPDNFERWYKEIKEENQLPKNNYEMSFED